MEDNLRKTVYCGCLRKETNVDYHISYVNGYKNGLTKRTINHYTCESRPLCQEMFVLNNCASFKELKKTEAEIKLG
ncbi:MAG: hypothetical protein ABSF32_11820 [Ignavibacteria bacterium]|jgi:hypothetical protein